MAPSTGATERRRTSRRSLSSSLSSFSRSRSSTSSRSAYHYKTRSGRTHDRSSESRHRRRSPYERRRVRQGRSISLSRSRDRYSRRRSSSRQRPYQRSVSRSSESIRRSRGRTGRYEYRQQRQQRTDSKYRRPGPVSRRGGTRDPPPALYHRRYNDYDTRRREGYVPRRPFPRDVRGSPPFSGHPGFRVGQRFRGRQPPVNKTGAVQNSIPMMRMRSDAVRPATTAAYRPPSGPSSIDRTTTCPFLLRVYYKLMRHYSLDAFNKYLLESHKHASAPADAEIQQQRDDRHASTEATLDTMDSSVARDDCNHDDEATTPIKESNLLEEDFDTFTSSELQLYTWKDTSLREIVDLVKDVCPQARIRNSRLSLKLLHLNPRGAYSLFDLGTLHNSRPGPEDRRTLLRSRFEIGDVVSIAILPTGARGPSGRHATAVTTLASTTTPSFSGPPAATAEEEASSTLYTKDSEDAVLVAPPGVADKPTDEMIDDVA